MVRNDSQRRAILIHDGSIDEYMATVVLFKMGNIAIEGIVVVAGNCLPDIGMQAAWKVQLYAGRETTPLALSKARGLNPFPWDYRTDCIKQSDVAALQYCGFNKEWPPYPDGDEWLAEYLSRIDYRITVICLGPLTPLAQALTRVPDGKNKIDELLWMGGAIDVQGNLDPATVPRIVANPYAEWNAFWDPEAVWQIFHETSFRILLFPLDLTNNVKVTSAFMSRLLPLAKRYRLADLAYQSYLVTSGAYYCMWDVATVAHLGIPDAYEDPVSIKLDVVTTGAKTGALVRSEGGRMVQGVMAFSDIVAFYSYVVDRFSSE